MNVRISGEHIFLIGARAVLASVSGVFATSDLMYLYLGGAGLLLCLAGAWR